MDTYKSKMVGITAPAELVYVKLSSPQLLQEKLANLPEEIREKVQDVKFTENSIAFSVNPVGEIKLVISEKVPSSRIVYAPASSPVPFNLAVELSATSSGTTNAVVKLNAELNFFIKSMVGGKLQEGVDKFAELLSRIPYEAI